jgi:NTE family protein
LALALHGGGALAAYQVGFLKCLARHRPNLLTPIVTGVSSGAINAAHLAAHPGPFDRAVDALVALWLELEIDRVFRVDTRSLVAQVLLWGWRLVSGGGPAAPRVRSLVDTSPLRRLLERALAPDGGPIHGIDANLAAGRLHAVAVSTTSYHAGRSVTWVQGRQIETWERPDRVSLNTRLSVDHVMASAALPLFFPAVRIEGSWYGDGAMGMTAPLAPAIHLGARKIITISTSIRPLPAEVAVAEALEYPPPLAIAGQLVNTAFLDALDEDALRLEKTNALLRQLPPSRWGTLRPVDLFVARPSRHLGVVAAEYEARLPGLFRHLTRGLGSREVSRPDLLSFLMFQPDYVRRLIDIGEADAEARREEIGAFLDGAPRGIAAGG